MTRRHGARLLVPCWIETLAFGWFLLSCPMAAQSAAGATSSAAPTSEWKTTQSGERSGANPAATAQNSSSTQSQTGRAGTKQSRTRKGSKSKKASKTKTFGNEVEKTFLGIGADLEEFFTGSRTVDK